jgi:hypothetical protein
VHSESEATRAVETTATAHTPGPWIIAPYCHGDELLEIVAEYQELPGGSKVAHWIAECDAGCDFGDDREEVLGRNVANAHLIAAAPDLLAALKALRADVVGALGIGVSDSIGHTNAKVLGHWCQVAFEAIAKAEGR